MFSHSPWPGDGKVAGSAHFTVLLTLAIAACTSDQPDMAHGPSIGDSAGVRMVQHHGQPQPDSHTTPELVYRHGYGLEDFTFDYVAVGALQPDGTAVVADAGSGQVLVIDVEGRGYSVLARRGSGPGEVQRVRSIMPVGQDSIWIEDDGNAKLALFAGGELVRTVNTQGDESLIFGLKAHALDDAGRFLMSTSAFSSDFDVPWLDGHLVVFDPNTNAADTVASFELAQRPDEGRNPYAPFGSMAFSGGAFVHGRTDRPQLTWFEPDGQARQIVRWEAVEEYPTDQHWQQLEATLRSDLARVNPEIQGNALDQLINRAVADYDVDATTPLPLFGSIHGTDQGRAWLEEYVPSSSPRPTRYQVVSQNGEWLYLVEFPTPVRILDIRDDLVLCVVTDDMEVQAIAVYRMTHGGIGP